MSTTEIISAYARAVEARYPGKGATASALCEKHIAAIAARNMDSTGRTPEAFALAVVRQALLTDAAFQADYRNLLGGK